LRPDQILRFGLTLLNHQTIIAPTTTTNKMASFILPSLFCLNTGCAAIRLWLFALRAKQGMRPLLAQLIRVQLTRLAMTHRL
jgi:hypothetical protein